MRKLFVIALLVALIPFTTGCRIGGLWGYDDDSGSNIGGAAATVAVAKNTVTLTQNVTFPASAVKLANVLWSDIPLVLGAAPNAITIYPASYSIDANGNIVLKYQKDIAIASLTAAVPTYSTTDGSKAVPFKVVYAGIEIAGSLAIENRTTDSTAAAAATTVNMTISGTTATGFTVTITSTVAPTGAPTTTTSTVTTTTVASTTISNIITVDSVMFGGAKLGGTSTDLVTVNSLTPKFTVNFSAATNWTTATTWTAKVTNVTSGNSFTLTSTSDAALFTIASAGTSIDITVGTAAGKALKTGQTYMVEFTATSLKNAAGTVAVSVPAVRYFKTNTAVTTLSAFNVTNALTTAPVVTLTFSSNLKAGQSYSGAVVLERYADANFTSKEATMTIDQTQADFVATNATLTITFKQAFVANKYYKVTKSSGSILDANNAAVEFPAYLTFQAK